MDHSHNGLHLNFGLAMTRQMHIGLFLLGTGSHPAGWRYPGAYDSFTDLDVILDIAQTAERGKFDLLFMGDHLNADLKGHPSFTNRLEPLSLFSAIAMRTRRIGLGITVSTTYSDPFSVARSFSSLDHISSGRAAWNAVTTANPGAAANFGTVHPEHNKRYQRAEEFVDVVTKLWDCWDDDAVVADRASGVYIDTNKVRSIDHVGQFFKVKGPLHQQRSPQGRPVILQAGGSEPGLMMAARTADVVFSVVQDFDECLEAYASLKRKVEQFGRSRNDVTAMPGVMPVIGRTDKEALEKLSELQSYVDDGNAIVVLSERFDHDMAQYDLNGPIPDLKLPDSYQSFARVLLSKAKRENMSLRDLYNLTVASRGHWTLCGSPKTIADTFQTWFEQGAADGFMIMPPYFPGGLGDFVDEVVPILQERGLFRHDYDGGTLRDHLGLTRAVARETRPEMSGFGEIHG
jgi:FMN-dependent oxidoreductase (nitrilotriacetate monooxygenase family)